MVYLKINYIPQTGLGQIRESNVAKLYCYGKPLRRLFNELKQVMRIILVYEITNGDVFWGMRDQLCRENEASLNRVRLV